MTGSKRTVRGLTRIRQIVTHFMSGMSARRAWYGHLPQISVPHRFERPALPNQRAMADVNGVNSR